MAACNPAFRSPKQAEPDMMAEGQAPLGMYDVRP